MKSHPIILLLFFISLSANVYSQNENSSGDNDMHLAQQERLEELRNQLDFGDTKSTWTLKKDEPKEDEAKDKKERKKRPNARGFSMNGSFSTIMAYILIILLVMGVIYMVFANARPDKKIDKETNLNDYIEDIEEIDALDGFKQALNVGDYRSAIRMQFIKVLQLLQETNKINWRPEKTNKIYLREIADKNLKHSFRELAGIYELVWYGNTKIDRENFEQLNPSFEQFINGFNGK